MKIEVELVALRRVAPRAAAQRSGLRAPSLTSARRPPAERGLVLSQRDETHLILTNSMKRWKLFLLIGCLVGGMTAPVWAQADDALPALVQVLAQTDDPQFQLDVLKGMAEGLKGKRGVTMPAGWEDLSTKLSRSANPEIRALVQGLSLTFGSSSALAALRQQLMDAKADPAARRRALDSLLAAKDPELALPLRQLLADPALRAGALRGLAAYDDAATPAAILGVYPSLTGVEKRDALNTLVARAAFAKAMLVALGRKTISSHDLTADIVHQLRNLKDPEINQQVGKLWGVARDSEGEKLKEIARYKTLLQAGPAGDPSRGRALFARTCQQCHTLFDTGGKVGPDITGSNRSDLDYILQNVLDPNAVIPNDYRTSTLETKDDRIITGIVTRQDDNAVTVVTANETLLISRSEVKSLQQGEISMMPEGLLQALSDAEVRDLVSYLNSPGQVPMQSSPDNLATFFNGKDLSGWEGDFDLWKVENGEIVGKTSGLKRNEWLSGPLLLGDFRLIVQVKLTPNAGNSGIQLRSQRLPDGEVKGYQADVGAGWWGKLYEEHGRGLIWKQSGEDHVKPEQWNIYEVLAVGSRIRTAINGHRCVDLDDPAGARQGVVAFQLHAGGPFEVRYKDLQLELNPKPELSTVRD